MIRTYGSLIPSSVLLLLCLSVSAHATPIVGAPIVRSNMSQANGGGIFSSSIKGDGGTSSNQEFHGSFGSGLGPRQFSLRVPPPETSEAPEPSTLALFGTGLMMMGGAIRRKFRQ